MNEKKKELIVQEINGESYMETSEVTIKNLIYVIRGQQVMLDSDLAMMYQVETKNLNKAVKRNVNRFPKDFCFQLSEEEYDSLRFQFGTSKEIEPGKGGRRYMPYAFTEQGISMLSAILRSEIAVKVSVRIMRTFVEMRRFMANNSLVLSRINEIEVKQLSYQKETDIALGHINRPKYYMGDRFHLACDIVANSYLGDLGWEYEKLLHIGKIYHETFFPKTEGKFLTAQKALTYIPFDPAVMKSGVKRNYMIDSEIWWDRKEDSGENGEIILSPKDEDPEDLQGDEDNRGGHFRVSKEIFYKEITNSEADRTSEKKKQLGSWDKKVINQLQSIRNNEQQNAKEGLEEDFRERIWQRVNTVQLNWKKLLNSFLQEEVCDYSFEPPDRRMQESEFFLPDYNVMKEKPKEVIFMVDTSGSIDDDTLSNVYSEMCNALTQFNGGIIGVLCFFDVKVHTPIYFSGIDDLLKIKPCGGGGTSYARVFDYIESFFTGDRIAEVVIFTDGEAEFPEETVANNIPVLWLFTNRGVRPPWGKYAYIDFCREI